MTHLILFDGDSRDSLLPLTFTRPVADLRVGILTIREKWERKMGLTTSFLTQDYLEPLFPAQFGEKNLLLNGSLLPDPKLISLLGDLDKGQAYTFGDDLLAACLDEVDMKALVEGGELGELEVFAVEGADFRRINRPADIFGFCDEAIREDFTMLTRGRKSAPLSDTNTLIGPSDQLFIEAGAEVEGAILNVKSGPIYVSKEVLIMEGAALRGPLSFGPGSVVKMGAKIYGATSLGPQCKVGGEINNVVFQANSNKGHDGYLGNSVIGQWCNLGADTNCSNLKNDYAEVKVWSYPEERFVKSGRQFHGLIMGDHSKTGINTMFNTGAVVGVSANVYGEGFPRTFIPSFSWGGAGGFQTYRADRAIATAARVMARRSLEMSPAEKQMLERIFADTEKYRPK